MPRIRVQHETRYDFEEPVGHVLRLLRLTPRSHQGQFVRRWRISVDADARLDRRIDAFGNISHLLQVEGPLETLSITVEGEIETETTHGIVLGSAERQPRGLFLRDTALTDASPAMQALAAAHAEAAGDDKLDALHKLMGDLHERFAASVETEPAPSSPNMQSAAAAFDARAGQAEDIAHVFIACARAMKSPARFVAGYLLRDDDAAAHAPHAWAEAYVPGIGWIGFDTIARECMTDRHIRLAVGCDRLDAAPVRGAGVGDDRLTMAIRVEQGIEIVDA